MLLEVEQVELDAEAAVVALARLLEPLEVGVEIGLRVERGAVDAGQLLVVLVAAPVRAGEPGQLERLDRLRVLEVRAAAEVGEVALGVEGDVALGGVDELDLVRLALPPRTAATASSARDLLARPLAALGDLALDLRLDPLEVGLGDRLGELEVVVEAVLDRRPDRDLHARVEPPHRLGEQVRRGMAEDVERVGVARRGWSGAGSGRRRRAAAAGRAARRSPSRAPPARRASGRSRARRRGRSRRREARARELSGSTTFMVDDKLITSEARTGRPNEESPIPDPEAV